MILACRLVAFIVVVVPLIQFRTCYDYAMLPQSLAVISAAFLVGAVACVRGRK